jgi:hypothetical protein
MAPALASRLVRLQPLREYDQPDLSNYVVHLTGRQGKRVMEVPAAITKQSPEERLESILYSGVIRAFPAFGIGSFDVVCFTECAPAAVQQTIKEAVYAPYGVAFTKQFVFELGGGPVLYIRGDLWQHRRLLPPDLRVFTAKYWPGVEDLQDGEEADLDVLTSSQWTHEREWRLSGSGSPPGLRFDWSEVAFLLLPDPETRERMAWRYEANFEEYAPYFRQMPAVFVDAETGEISDPDGIWVR